MTFIIQSEVGFEMKGMMISALQVRCANRFGYFLLF